MQALNYSLINKRPVVIIKSSNGKYKSTFMDENRHSKLFANDEVNNYVNEQIQKALHRIDEKR